MHLTPVQFETRVALVVIEFFLVKNDTDLGRNDVLPTLKGIFIINFQIMLVTKTTTTTKARITTTIDN